MALLMLLGPRTSNMDSMERPLDTLKVYQPVPVPCLQVQPALPHADENLLIAINTERGNNKESFRQASELDFKEQSCPFTPMGRRFYHDSAP